jgi:hypothetical protein
VLLYLVESETWQDVALDQGTTDPIPERRNSGSIM